MLINFFIKKKFITIVPLEETYFHCVDFAGDKKLSYDSVLFNYQKLSPFINSQISYIQKDKKIMLWFYDNKYKSLWTIPEGFFFYNYFATKYENIIATIENKCTNVIQNKILCYQSPAFASEQECSLLQKNYDINNTEKKSLQWYKENQKKFKQVSIIQLLQFFLDKQKSLKILKQKALKAVFPLMIFTIFLSAGQFFIYNYLNEKYEEITIKKQRTQKSTKSIFKKIEFTNQNIQYIKQYIQKYNQNGLDIVKDLGKLAKQHNLKFYHFDYSLKIVTFHAEAKNIEKFLESLSQYDKIKSFKLTRQIKKRDGKLEIALDVVLKTLNGNPNEQ